jgi:hypothetical protein
MTETLTGSTRSDAGAKLDVPPPDLPRGPTHRIRPAEVVSTAGDECIELAREGGLILDPWQCDELRGACSEKADGSWSAFEVGEVVARQNGKNGILIARQLGGLFAFGEWRQLHTAHQMKTSRKHALELMILIQSTPAFDARVKIMRTGNELLAIELLDGRKIEFIARSGKSGRGLDADTLYLDEALFLLASMVGAVLPLMRTYPNPQVWYMSSAPTWLSAFLHGLLARAENPDPDELELYLSAWLSPPDVRYDDERNWYRVNPALGGRITVAQMRREWRTLRRSPEGVIEFARELLSIPEGGDSQPGTIDYARWSELADPADPARQYRGSHVAGARAIGLAVSPDGLWSSFGVFGVRDDGDFHIGTVDRRSGTAWVVARAKELHAELDVPVRIVNTDPASALADQLDRAGVPVEAVTDVDYARACFNVLEWVKAGRLRHANQETMNRSVAAAGKRSVGRDLWAWSRPGAIDITPLSAGTAAASGIIDGDGDVGYLSAADLDRMSR